MDEDPLILYFAAVDPTSVENRTRQRPETVLGPDRLLVRP